MSKSKSADLGELEARLAAVRGALACGEASGPAEHFDFDAYVRAKRRLRTGRDRALRRPRPSRYGHAWRSPDEV